MEIGTQISTSLGKLTIDKFLGKGKSGYSYLATSNGVNYVFKAMHYEHCSYYCFGNSNKVDLEISSYQVLSDIGISIPRLLEYNRDENYLIKEFIDGQVASNHIANNDDIELCIKQIFIMFANSKRNGINIDYFPSNFVLSDRKLYYIDYEHNLYDENWDLINWGLFYWANTNGMKKYLESNDLININEDYKSGVPIKTPFYSKVNKWVEKYAFA